MTLNHLWETNTSFGIASKYLIVKITVTVCTMEPSYKIPLFCPRWNWQKYQISDSSKKCTENQLQSMIFLALESSYLNPNGLR